MASDIAPQPPPMSPSDEGFKWWAPQLLALLASNEGDSWCSYRLLARRLAFPRAPQIWKLPVRRRRHSSLPHKTQTTAHSSSFFDVSTHSQIKTKK